MRSAVSEGIIGKCGVVHIDGSHTFDNVAGDMEAGEADFGFLEVCCRK